MDIIEITNLRLRAVIGFSPHELQAPQDIVICLRIGHDRGLAGESDNPADAYNYRTVSKAVAAYVEGSQFSLLEKLAEEIARLITLDYAAPWVEVSVHKPGALRRSDSVGLRITRKPADYAMNVAYLSIGSNIAPDKNIVAAICELRRHTTVLALSPVYRTVPQGFRQQAPFLNMAAKIHTLRSPDDFKTAVIDRIEVELERVRDPANKNAPRTIDLDISLWNSAIMKFGAKPWKVPDPAIVNFAHVAIPLADIAPDYIHPEAGASLGEIANRFDKQVARVVDLNFSRPT